MPKFNDGQQKAILHVNGPMMALAGPGSGKTTCMVHRIQHLIEKAHVSPANILVVTFTRASAREMEERFKKLMKGSKYQCTFGTFHSIFFYILKMAYGYQSGNILLDEEKYSIIRDIIRNKQLEFDDEDEVVHDVIHEIGMMKGDMIPLEHFYSSCIGEEIFRQIVKEYETKMHSMGKIDFDNMMVYCYELLKERPDILKKLQARYTYILVDEFQDINKIQYEITKMLAAPHNNLFVVGDDDQSIYGFRGAKPEIMLHFKDDYKDVVTTLLDVNYRCNRNITEGALRVIKHNTVRYDKKIVSNHDYEEPIRIHHMKTRQEENQHILKMIRDYHEQGMPYNEMAIIMRTNVQARTIVHKLMEYNIPFQMRDKVPCIYDHFTVLNILDYIKAAMGIRDRALFLKIWNRPNRYLSRELLSESIVDLNKIKTTLDNKDWAVENIEQLEYDLKVLSGLRPYAAVNFIRKAIGYDRYLADYAEYRHLNVDDLYHTLDEVQEMAKQYRSYREWFDGIESYRLQFKEHMKQKRDLNQSSLSVTTMHSAKGLEFDAVFILEANESIIPYKKAGKYEEIEEERRMFYVAMTRARHHLHIYEVEEYYNKNLAPSRFLNELCEK